MFTIPFVKNNISTYIQVNRVSSEVSNTRTESLENVVEMQDKNFYAR